MTDCSLKLKHFLRSWDSSSVHLHAQGNEGRHGEFINEFKKFDAPCITINAKIYQSTEKIFIQHMASELGLLRVSNMKTFETRLSPLIKDQKSFRCVFLVTNAEELAGFNSLLLQHFLRFVSSNSQKLKLITVSILPWRLIEARLLNFRTNIATIVHRLPEFSTRELDVFASDIPAISKIPTNPMSIQSLAAYLPKNKNPVFLRKLVASRKPQNHGSFQRLPANVALTLICSYMATWNPAASDQRFVGEKSQGKRRNQTRNAQDILDPSAKQFTIDRLKNLYEGMHKSLLAECGVFNANVQIPILLQFGHLERVSDIQNLAKPKFRCSAPYDYVNKIFNEFVKKHTAHLSQKTSTEEFRNYLQHEQL
ncbi:hypothetical protein M3Y97_00434000 [Aphelenchoides bicaudatus]|nr:hypothetical protein M3Y97_00434000 [Aphelenchoides bicaudatus]